MNKDVLRGGLLRLYEQGPGGFIFTEPDGTIVRINQTLLSWLGYTQDEMPARRMQELLTIPGKMFYENQYDPLLRMQGYVNEVAFDFVCKDQKRLPVLINSILEKGESDQDAIIVSSVFSATQRRQYEQELLVQRRRAEQIAAIVAKSSDAIITTDAAVRIESWNSAAERMFGWSAKESIGRDLREFLRPFGSASNSGRVMGQLRAGESVTLETQSVPRNGRAVDVSVALTPHLDLGGQLISILLIARDVSERRMLERLQQEFLAIASHELKNPVAAIKAHAQLMQRRAQYNERSAASIVNQADQLKRLIDDLLAASEIQSDRLNLQLEPLDLSAEVGTVAESMSSVRPTIDVDRPDEPVMVMADRWRMSQVLTNLLTNAIKYSPEDSLVTLRLERGVDSARLSVIDRGVCIPAEALPRLFDRFFRAEGASSQAHGLGLGLYITRTIVEAHGGTIEVISEPSQGSNFSVVLPLAE
jgi:PAS domain S-box-containing protein